jgi:hypothetical protein
MMLPGCFVPDVVDDVVEFVEEPDVPEVGDNVAPPVPSVPPDEPHPVKATNIRVETRINLGRTARTVRGAIGVTPVHGTPR